MSTADTLAKVIRQRYDQCPPGKWPMEQSLAEFILEHAAESGLVIVEAPNPVEAPPGWAGDWVACYPVDTVSDPISAWQDGTVADSDGNFVSADKARRTALALLAAATAAEAVTA